MSGLDNGLYPANDAVLISVYFTDLWAKTETGSEFRRGHVMRCPPLLFL